jgi:hypothetical protein
MRSLALGAGQPWRCLCRGLEQITNSFPRRRTSLQFSQIRFTLARTFIGHFLQNDGKRAEWEKPSL